jgi:hypothetical protein
MRPAVAFAFALVVAACVGGPTNDLPTVAAPTTPLPTIPMADVLTPVTPTTLVGTPGSSTIVQVRATTAAGKPVNATTMAFQVQAGGGSVEPVVTTTVADGIASAKWTFGNAPGVNLLRVSGGANAATPVNFTASTLTPSGTRVP